MKNAPSNEPPPKQRRLRMNGRASLTMTLMLETSLILSSAVFMWMISMNIYVKMRSVFSPSLTLVRHTIYFCPSKITIFLFIFHVFHFIPLICFFQIRYHPKDYMPHQKDITSNMRAILVDWLVEVAEEYKLSSETLYLAVSYIDRYLAVSQFVIFALSLFYKKSADLFLVKQNNINSCFNMLWHSVFIFLKWQWWGANYN